MTKPVLIIAAVLSGLALWPAGPLSAQSAYERHYLVSEFGGEEPGFGGATWTRAHFDATWRSVRSVNQAISAAAEATTIDYEFLLAQAYLESAMNPQAQARTSSASGLFQFINSTWLRTVRRHGARFGLDDWAALIDSDAGGSIAVNDRRLQRQLLDLRKDPLVASVMAAGLAEDNREALLPVLGREPTYTELYLAHFLGANGATRFVSLMQHRPSLSAASQFPAAARANRAIFYHEDGSARSLAGVKALFDRKIERALGELGHHPGPRAYAPAPLAMAAHDRAPTGQASEEGPVQLPLDEGVFTQAASD